MNFDFHSSQLGKASLFAEADIQFLPLTVLYAFMTILPFYDKTFSALSHNSPQQSRFVIGMTVWHELFLNAFGTDGISSKNVSSFASFGL